MAVAAMMAAMSALAQQPHESQQSQQPASTAGSNASIGLGLITISDSVKGLQHIGNEGLYSNFSFAGIRWDEYRCKKSSRRRLIMSDYFFPNDSNRFIREGFS